MARTTYVKPIYGQHMIIFTKREAFVTLVLSLEVGIVSRGQTAYFSAGRYRLH